MLTADPGMGVVRHVDAGYERAVEVARERGCADNREQGVVVLACTSVNVTLLR